MALAHTSTAELLAELERRPPMVDLCSVHDSVLPNPDMYPNIVGVCGEKFFYQAEGDCIIYQTEVRCPECHQLDFG